VSNLATRLQTTMGPSFAIERELGGGGMSHVFLVADAALSRRIVVKILPPNPSAKVDAERFRREIQIAASLQHPCIVPVLTTGFMDDVPYYTMPFVAGESLRTKVTSGQLLPLSRAVRVLRDVASAIAHAHDHGVAHRDLKPDNVLLSSGYAVVTDFGIAKAVSSSRDEADPELTSRGMTVGTPAYMAPEQATADPTADHRVDVYALGVMAFEILTGPATVRRPHRAGAARGAHHAPAAADHGPAARSSARPRDARDAVPLEVARRSAIGERSRRSAR
jgi:serine/threonine-protein kinase